MTRIEVKPLFFTWGLCKLSLRLYFIAGTDVFGKQIYIYFSLIPTCICNVRSF